jgi:hypothetical protein
LADTWPEKIGQTREAGTAELDALRAEFEAGVEDPDGNQLLFNYSNDEV